MNINFLFCIACVCFSQVVSAQLFENQNGKNFTPLPQFSPAFKKASKIKSIRGTFSYKKQGETMVKTDYYQLVEFDSTGKICRFFQTNKSGSLIDTTWIEYIYNSDGLLFQEKHKAGNQFHTKRFSYDSLQQLTLVSYFIPASEEIPLNKERIEIQHTESGTKYRYFNQYDLPFQVVSELKNEAGYLLERKTEYIMTGSSTRELFSYSKKGLLKSIKTIYSEDETRVEEIRFEYDDLGKLTESQRFRNNMHSTEIQVLYNSKQEYIRP